MGKILFSLITTLAVLLLATDLTRSFFSDTEVSNNNQMVSGKIDLLIDNDSYYNGQKSPKTTWQKADLDGHLFFDFDDLKPGDWGEDTISLRIDNNDAWVCMKVDLKKDDDFTCTEPETVEQNDPSCSEPDDDLFDGELGKNIHFIFWGDDGNNVLETDEIDKIFKKGTAKNLFSLSNWIISDSVFNIWQFSPKALAGSETYFIGKAWCFGSLSLVPVAAGQGVSPEVNPGFVCDGSGLKNSTQTDILEADIEFYSVQSRNNSDFVCDPNWLLEGVGKDQNNPGLGAIKYRGYPAGYEFWFTPNADIWIYKAGRSYHNYYEVNPPNPAEWCGTTVVPNRPPYNMTGHTFETVYWKAYDVTDSEPGVLKCS